MDLITLLIMIAVVGVVVWVLVTYVPMLEPFRRAIIVIATVAVALYVLSLFTTIPSIRVGR